MYTQQSVIADLLYQGVVVNIQGGRHVLLPMDVCEPHALVQMDRAARRLFHAATIATRVRRHADVRRSRRRATEG